MFPLIARQLLDRLEIGWTVRIVGFLFLFNLAVVLALVKPRNTSRKEGPLVEFRTFLDPWYSLFSLVMFLVVLGLYFAYYYVSPLFHAAYSISVVVHPNRRSRLRLLLKVLSMSLLPRLLIFSS